MTGAGWSVEQVQGSAASFHGRDPVVGGRRRVWVCEVDRPALVLGSTQPAGDVDGGAAADLGVEVVRRRSGGGAVLLDPGAAVWIDAVVPAGDELWHHDVGRAFEWFGDTWAAALVALGVDAAAVEVHRGGLVTTSMSPVVCFAGLGPGEVTVSGAKVVGVAQRRTRDWIRLQSALLLDWDPDRHARLLAPGLARVVSPAGATGAAAGERVDGRAALGALPVRPLRTVIPLPESDAVPGGLPPVVVDVAVDSVVEAVRAALP